MTKEFMDGLITKTDSVMGGRACISGTEITVREVAELDESDATSTYPLISLAAYYAATAYYYLYEEEMKQEKAEDEARRKKIVETYTKNPKDDENDEANFYEAIIALTQLNKQATLHRALSKRSINYLGIKSDDK